MSEYSITIAGRVYRKNPAADRYQIAYADLEDLQMRDIPPHSHLEILNLPAPHGAEVEVYGLNSGDDGEVEGLCVYGGATFKVTLEEGPRILDRPRRRTRRSRGPSVCKTLTGFGEYGFRNPRVARFALTLG